MAVNYKGAYTITGVVRHGEPAQPEVPQTIYLTTYEDGMEMGQGLDGHFSRMFTNFVVTSGDAGAASVDAINGHMSGIASGSSSNYNFTFAVTASDSEGSETIYFAYEVVPVNGTQPDYNIDYDAYTATFTPRWTEYRPVHTVSGSGSPNQEIDFSEQLILDGGSQNDYVWSGTLTPGLTLSSEGVVSGTLSAEDDTDYGLFPVTVTNTLGDSAVLQLRIQVYILL